MHRLEAAVFGRSKPTEGPKLSIVLISPRQLHEKGICYHPNHLRLLWKRGEFPKPINLSARKIAWRESDLDAWIAAKSDQRAPRSEIL